jgi:2-oxo-4-hydroxy-4-carboxy--5-ureidoimidazoline (OHCU) decarboxylase
MYDSRITAEDYQTLSNIINQYNARQNVPFQAMITSDTRYSNIIMMSRRMVSATKRFLSVGSIQQYGNNDFSRG